MTLPRNLSILAENVNSNGVMGAPSGGAVVWTTPQTSNFTAVAGVGYPVNTTSSAITVTLPASPVTGQKVAILDYAGTAVTNNINIDPNGNKINGFVRISSISTSRQSYNFVYVDSTQGWVSYAQTYIPIATAPYTISYLIVGGGGGSANNVGGGGGAGGLLTGTTSVYKYTTYPITVGGGGTGGVANGAAGTNGNDSVAFSLTALGGGFGGSSVNGNTGGSGGGSGGNTTNSSGGAGTSGQGYAGGGSVGATTYNGGGGGGAGGVGTSGTTSVFGNGGIGVSSSITGTATYYAGGGGGGGATGSGGTGGSGGGGNGSGPTNGIPGNAGTANTGGGGGGGSGGLSPGAGANGGSGIVILSIPTANYSGVTTGSPTVTTSGSNTILQFVVSGSYTA
jgi:hypothetical protein